MRDTGRLYGLRGATPHIFKYPGDDFVVIEIVSSRIQLANFSQDPAKLEDFTLLESVICKEALL